MKTGTEVDERGYGVVQHEIASGEWGRHGKPAKKLLLSHDQAKHHQYQRGRQKTTSATGFEMDQNNCLS